MDDGFLQNMWSLYKQVLINTIFSIQETLCEVRNPRLYINGFW